MRYSPAVLLGAAGVAVAQNAAFQSYPDCKNGLLAKNKVCDVTLSPPERAAALVAAMTNEEKLQNIISKSKGAPRIGLPAYNWWGEALHGVAYAPGTQFHFGPGPFNSSTSFPMPVLMAAAFDDELIEKIGEVIGIEGRAWGNAGFSAIDYWTPNVNPFKDPRWGRGSETPGEDILRVKRYAEYMIRGLEGPEEQRRVVATCKHYAGNDFEDWGGHTRHDFDVVVSMQDLAEYYMMPFQQCTRDSKVGSIMCAYNAVNGVPSCASPYLLQTILREHWGWTDHNNYITSDCEAVLDVSLNHKYAKTNAEGTAMCFEAGMDLSCEYESSSDVPGAWSQGLLKVPTIDRALKRLYEGLVRAGYFDNDHSPYNSIGWDAVNQPSAQALALQVAVEGTVLLKNDGALPLKDVKSSNLALIGFWANNGKALSGGYSGTPAFTHTPAYAATQLGLNFTTAWGPVLQDSSAPDNWTANALAAANTADTILYFGGLDTTAAGETKDRYSLEWPAAQLTLITQLSKLNKTLIIIQMGDQLDDTPLLALPGVNAILWANWPGQDGGPAVFQLLTGAKSPSGRLPVSQYPANYTDLVPVTEMALRPSATSPGRTYRWYPNTIFPFGFGLSYTTFSPSVSPSFPKSFSISELTKGCTNKHKDTCPFPSLQVTVKNTGNFTSDYVALAFLKGEYGPKPYPIKTLSSYARVRDLKPGEEKKAELKWNLGDIARHDENGNTVLYPGRYTVLVDEPTLSETVFELVGEELVLDVWPQK
ncbi:glycosyl hydrolase family 3 N-terminal domain-containing protein [Podospora aff. communis PSN243]|uniref:xylan 1,4-beta-xylosidase n=1 Tax=Podospora aff. communis PSN243 TaxID=3040156 RepID=A0AAV9GFQ1_9PEZI|nr:glycosyl hydrolase family 3 N-terminal domain-containing protein [Podospora aff. communis PSN243]